MNRNRLAAFICILLMQPATAQVVTVKEYIETYKDIAMQEMKDYGIPASITLAQGLLESGNGNSRLAKEGNNHFGIKCKKDWTGCTIKEDDDELQECFRCYTSALESYKDHSKFLKSNARYANLFTLAKDDYKGWAQGLRNAGYATNARYPQLLTSTIERNRLGRFDTMVMQGYDPGARFMKANIEVVDNHVPLTVAQPGQQVPDIAKEHQMGNWQIYKYNDLKKGDRINPGDVLYLKPKKRKAAVPTHVVKEGETMWLISQKYAIKLKHLYKKNLMERGTQPRPGTELQLQHKAETMPDTGFVPAIAKKPEPIPAKPLLVEAQNTEPDAVFNPENIYHTVKKAETLYGISRIYNVSVEAIKTNNNLGSNTINEGQVLIIKLKDIPAAAPVEEQQAISHTVKSGETLYGISKQYNVTIEHIVRLNNLADNNLKPGQVLLIK